MEAEGSTAEHVLYCSETGLLWKMLDRTCITQGEERHCQDTKPMKDRVSLSLCVNTITKLRMKPLQCTIYPQPLSTQGAECEQGQAAWPVEGQCESRVSGKWLRKQLHKVFALVLINMSLTANFL